MTANPTSITASTRPFNTSTANYTCEIQAEGVRVFFWPIEDDHINASKNVSDTSPATTYTTVSNGYTLYVLTHPMCVYIADLSSTSPSVYVVYENIRTYADYGITNTIIEGKGEYITAAYNAGDLSTSVCHWGRYKPLNYTEMQYPPPNSAVKDCYDPHWIHGDANGDPTYIVPSGSFVKASPYLSYPTDITALKPAWTTCTAPYMGPFDPPRTLNKATAMAPEPSHTLPPAPGATAIPDEAPATSLPDPQSTQDPQKNPSQQATSVVDATNPNPATDVKSGSQSEQLPNQPKVDAPVPSPQGSTPPSNDPSSNDPVVSDAPNHSTPSSGTPSNSQPPSNQPPDHQTVNSQPLNGQPSSIQSPNNQPSTNQPSDQTPKDNKPSNNQPSNEKPSNHQPSNDPPTAGQHLSGSPSNVEPSSSSKSDDPSLPEVSGTSLAGQTSATGTPHIVGPEATQGLGGIIVTALGYRPEHTAGSAGGRPNPPDTNTEGLTSDNSIPIAEPAHSILINSVPAPLLSSNAGSPETLHIDLGGQHVAVSEASNDVVLGGQTLIPGGSPITIANVPISLPSPVPTPQAMAPEYNVGGQTITANPTVIYVQGTTPEAGDPLILISRVPVSLQPAGGLVVGDSTLPTMPTGASPVQPGYHISAPIYTIGGQTFAANPTAIAVAGTTISPGGPGITVAGTPINLPQSGGLVIGDKTLPIHPTPLDSASDPIAPIYTVGGTIFTANSDALAIS